MMLRRIALVFMLVVVFEGAIRKWFLPELSNALFLLKDLLMGAAFAAYLTSTQKFVFRSRDLVIWKVWVLLAVAQALFAGLSFSSLIGLRYYLAPIPLIFVIPTLIREPEDLRRLAAAAGWLSFPICALAVLQ
jgi:hypothetical protein